MIGSKYHFLAWLISFTFTFNCLHVHGIVVSRFQQTQTLLNDYSGVFTANTHQIPMSEITYYPLDPLTSSEIKLAAFLINTANNSNEWIFKSITLKEPEKSELFLSYCQDDDISVSAAGKIERKAWAFLLDPLTFESYEVVVNFNRLTVESWKQVGKGSKPPMVTTEDVVSAEGIALDHPDVIKRIQALGFNLSQVICDVWDAGYIADNPNYVSSKRIFQIYFYGVLAPGDNFYAHPFDFIAYVDTFTKRLLGIENLPIQNDFNRDNRTRNSVPAAQANYFSSQKRVELNSSIISNGMPSQNLPTKGPNFSLDHRYKLTWQNFSMRIGYNAREGVILHHVKYIEHGKIRPVLYRISLSEIFVTYGDPRPPFHRKKSFDMGEYRLGSSSSELSSDLCGPDARYLNMVYHNELGEPYTLKNAICVTEEDSGLLWAHYDWIQGKTAALRSKRLSISFAATVCHSDYWISWRFYNDATIELSVKLTGLKNTNLMAIDVKAPMYGNLMMNQVYSSINQYHFAVRIDADVDGVNNSVVVEDVVALEDDCGSPENPYGNGISTKETILETVGKARTNVSPSTRRTWKIINSKNNNSISGTPVSWALAAKGDYVPLLLKKDSPLRKNTAWTDYNVWVLPYNSSQIFASGLWMDSDGLADWVSSANASTSIVDVDVVVWHVFSLTNVPATENWPVSSDQYGSTGFIFKPNAFFNRNPSLK